MNLQPIEKLSASRMLDVHSIFYTVQGEGPFQGHPSVFLRLAGCNLQCPHCDTDYTSVRAKVAITEVCRLVMQRFPAHNLHCERLVVITGGEPFRQPFALNELVGMLHSYSRIQIETNGTLPITEAVAERATIVVSPKTPKIHDTAHLHANAFKYVGSKDDLCEDGLPHTVLGLGNPKRREPVARPRRLSTPIYLQPMDSHDAALNKYNNSAVARSCMEHGYRLQPQIHKFFDLE